MVVSKVVIFVKMLHRNQFHGQNNDKRRNKVGLKNVDIGYYVQTFSKRILSLEM